jgi:hypothetical protein
MGDCRDPICVQCDYATVAWYGGIVRRYSRLFSTNLDGLIEETLRFVGLWTTQQLQARERGAHSYESDEVARQLPHWHSTVVSAQR